MLNKQIQELRKKLDEAILERRDYSEIYALSIELDELIAQYYRENSNEKITTTIIGKENVDKNNFDKIGSLAKLRKEDVIV